MLAIIIWILLFMILVLVHELWHFIAAKKSWVKVLEFGIWIPPKALTLFKDKSWTEYTLNWLPLWWFVRLKWENPHDTEDFLAKDSFISAKLWKKIIILFGWVTMNLIFAWLFFTIAFWKWITPLQVIPVNMVWYSSESYIMPSYDFLQKQWFISWKIEWIPVKVEQIMPWSLAEKVWINSWDNILAINEIKIDTLTLSKTLKDYIWKEFMITYKRDKIQFKSKVKCPDDSCLLWIMMQQWWKANILPIKFSLWNAMTASVHEIKAETKLTIIALTNLWKNLLSFNKDKIKSSVEKMSGPVWAVKVWELILQEFWIWHYLAFGWMISLALAIFNILPLPALDGGRALWVLIQAVFFRLKPQFYFNIENYINLVFFVLLMWFWIYVILLDLYRFWGVKIPGLF